MPEQEHPAFTLAKSLPEPWRTHFPHSPEEAREWKPYRQIHPLAMRVLAVAQTRVECSWAAYINAVPGMDHEQEQYGVLTNGTKLPEDVARLLFPAIPKEVLYAE